jgi:hypothetical protein
MMERNTTRRVACAHRPGVQPAGVTESGSQSSNFFEHPSHPHQQQQTNSIRINMPRHSGDDEERHNRKHRPRRTRSRSPRTDHHHKRHRSRSPRPAPPAALPYKARQLSKRHYEEYKPLFQSYLDIQKQLNLDELDERETRGRWKSFISRWYAYTSLPNNEYKEDRLTYGGTVEI